MRRANATLLSVLASACGGKVVLDATGSSTSSSSSSTGIGGTGGFSSSSTSTDFSSSVGSTGGFTSGTDFAASSTSSTVTASTGDVNPGCGSFQISDNPACEACASGACCGELQACDVGTPCSALFNCVTMCAPGDTACASQCESQNQGGLAALQALDTCFDTNCGQQSACLVPICDSGASTLTALCAGCLGADCCPPIEACIADSTCVTCLGGMNMTPQCTQDAAFTQLTACIGMCNVQCM